MPLQNVHISNGGLVLSERVTNNNIIKILRLFAYDICICTANIVFNAISANKIMKGKKPNATHKNERRIEWELQLIEENRLCQFSNRLRRRRKKRATMWRANIHRSQVWRKSERARKWMAKKRMGLSFGNPIFPSFYCACGQHDLHACKHTCVWVCENPVLRIVTVASCHRMYIVQYLMLRLLMLPFFWNLLIAKLCNGCEQHECSNNSTTAISCSWNKPIEKIYNNNNILDDWYTYVKRGKSPSKPKIYQWSQVILKSCNLSLCVRTCVWTPNLLDASTNGKLERAFDLGRDEAASNQL